MKAHDSLSDFLEPYDQSIANILLELRQFISDLVPETNELIWDNYNALAIAYSKSDQLKDAFCHLAIYTAHVNFGFNRGSELKSDNLELEGKGKLIRHIKIKSLSSFPKEALSKLIIQATRLSETRNPKLLDKKTPGISIVMSISEKKIRPKKA